MKKIEAAGPGGHLHDILEAWVRPCDACRALAARMDRRGVAWCRENEDYIAEQMVRHAHAGWVPFSRRVARRLVREACDRAEGIR